MESNMSLLFDAAVFCVGLALRRVDEKSMRNNDE
jgi:hypothetical protein